MLSLTNEHQAEILKQLALPRREESAKHRFFKKLIDKNVDTFMAVHHFIMSRPLDKNSVSFFYFWAYHTVIYSANKHEPTNLEVPREQYDLALATKWVFRLYHWPNPIPCELWPEIAEKGFRIIQSLYKHPLEKLDYGNEIFGEINNLIAEKLKQLEADPAWSELAKLHQIPGY